MTDQGQGLTQSLGEKMQAVMGRYGKQPERPNARPCVLCDLAHRRVAIAAESEAAQAESFARAREHTHGEPTEEQRVVGDAVRVLINEELDGASCELIARRFHETYEALAPVFGYLTRQESAKPWEQVPIRNRALMVAVVNSLITQGVIRCG